MVATLVRTRRPDRIVCALDEDWRPAWRVALIPSYKTHRPGGAGTTPARTRSCRTRSGAGADHPGLLAAFGIATAGAADYEADDIIGTLATREPGPIEVATGDRDLFQVVDDDRGVRVLYCGAAWPSSKCSTTRRSTPSTASRPRATRTSRRCAGPSDGLPGVPGVGEKTAARLIDRYGSLDGILAALDDPAAGFAPGLRNKLKAARDYLAVAPTVVRVAREIKLPPLDTALPAAPRSPERVAELAEAWNLSGAVRRLTEVPRHRRVRSPPPSSSPRNAEGRRPSNVVFGVSGGLRRPSNVVIGVSGPRHHLAESAGTAWRQCTLTPYPSEALNQGHRGADLRRGSRRFPDTVITTQGHRGADSRRGARVSGMVIRSERYGVSGPRRPPNAGRRPLNVVFGGPPPPSPPNVVLGCPGPRHHLAESAGTAWRQCTLTPYPWGSPTKLAIMMWPSK